MDEREALELMTSDLPIGIKEFVALHDLAVSKLVALKICCDNNDHLTYLMEYIKFLEDHYMEDL